MADESRGRASSSSTLQLGSLISRLRGRTSPAEELEDRTPRHEHRPAVYDALSYAWGTETPDQQILINEKFFAVTPTLEKALHDLRTEDHPFQVWIDAICIDQENANEKVNQIKKLDRIHVNAQRAFAWLGEATPASDAAIAAFKFAREVSESVTDDDDSNLHAWQTVFPQSLSRVQSPRYTECLVAIYGLIGRGYWRRAWIVQEVVVAKSVLVMCGNASIPWRNLERAIVLTACTPLVCCRSVLRLYLRQNGFTSSH